MRFFSIFVGAGLLAVMLSGNSRADEPAAENSSLKLKTAVYESTSKPVRVHTVARRHYRTHRGSYGTHSHSTYDSAPNSYYAPGYSASYYYGYPGYGSYYYAYPGYGVGYYPPYYNGGYYGGYGTFYNGLRLGW